jgi:alpha-tubulin suppressor-like RCC1 family protein
MPLGYSHTKKSSGVSVLLLSVGGWHTCILLVNGGLLCWGANDFGQLGIGSNINQNSPHSVELLAGIFECTYKDNY